MYKFNREHQNFFPKSTNSPSQIHHITLKTTKKELRSQTSEFFIQAPTRFELVIEVLQTFALPLGHGAKYKKELSL